MNKVLVAMSGGIDSAVSALLIKNKGYECSGITMKLVCPSYYGLDEEYEEKNNSDINDAKNVADKLGIEHITVDFKEEFKNKVADNFAYSYEAGQTPNPCVVCNKEIKFGVLLDKAKEMGFDYLATGHYAQIETKDGRFLLKKAVDETKDQSYFLYSLSQEVLSKVIFPLGETTKDEARKFAEENGFVNARKKDSQDICFVPDGEYVNVIKSITNKIYPKGNFLLKDGTVAGQHEGIIKYTVGQRKGLGISLSKPMYVLSKNVKENTVVLGDNEDLFSKALNVTNVNWIYFENPPSEFQGKVKIRFNQKEQDATIKVIDRENISVEFINPQRAIAKGQSAVVYFDGYVVCGGIII